CPHSLVVCAPSTTYFQRDGRTPSAFPAEGTAVPAIVPGLRSGLEMPLQNAGRYLVRRVHPRAHHVEPCVAVLTGQAAGEFDELPAAPAGLGVVHREQ